MNQVTLRYVKLLHQYFLVLRLLRAYAASRKLPVDNVTRDIMEKEIDEALDARQGISRRDFMKVAGAGGAVMVLLKC